MHLPLLSVYSVYWRTATQLTHQKKKQKAESALLSIYRKSSDDRMKRLQFFFWFVTKNLTIKKKSWDEIEKSET